MANDKECDLTAEEVGQVRVLRKNTTDFQKEFLIWQISRVLQDLSTKQLVYLLEAYRTLIPTAEKAQNSPT